MPYLPAISHTVAATKRFFDFSKWPLSTIFNLLYACLDHPLWVFAITMQNLVGIDALVSIICKIFIFCKLALKMHIHALKEWFWGMWPSKWGTVLTWPHSCFRKIFSTRDQVVVYQCMVFFDFSSVSEAVKCKQHRFFQRYLMSTNSLCVLFCDKATAVI